MAIINNNMSVQFLFNFFDIDVQAYFFKYFI